jgi:hypothetical protein
LLLSCREFDAVDMVKGTVVNNVSFTRKLRRWYANFKWPVIAALWFIAFLLGYIGFSRYFTAIGQERTSWNVFYLTLQLFVLESGAVPGEIGWQLQVARLLAPALTVYTAAQALAIFFQEQLQNLRLRLLKDHVVICGLGCKGWLLAEKLHQNGEKVVVIEQNKDNDTLPQCRDYNLEALIGDAADPEILKKARVDNAKCVVSICGNDGINAEIAVHARDLAHNHRRSALSCFVHIIDFQLCRLLREQEIERSQPDIFRLEFFNIFESGARLLLNEYPPFDLTERDHNNVPHIVIVDANRFGESVLINIAKRWWDNGNTDKGKLRITIIDRDANAIKTLLCLRYIKLESICELDTLQLDIGRPEFEQTIFTLDRDWWRDVTAIYVCIEDDSLALTTGLKLYQLVKSSDSPVTIRMTRDAGLTTLLRKENVNYDSYYKLRGFSLLDRTCVPDFIFNCVNETLAMAIHEDYVLTEMKKGYTRATNPSLVSWNELPENLKESNRNQVEHFRTRLHDIGCDIAMTTDWDIRPFVFSQEELELMARKEHERFVIERLRAGWKYGREKVLEKKISPALVDWNNLPQEEQDKNRDIVRSMPAFLSKAGFYIYRLKKE